MVDIKFLKKWFPELNNIQLERLKDIIEESASDAYQEGYLQSEKEKTPGSNQGSNDSLA